MLDTLSDFTCAESVETTIKDDVFAAIAALKAMSFDNLYQMLQNIPEINEARVLYHKTEIQLDTYTVQSKDVAEKLL